jgi:hypothetical protein
VSTRDTVRIGGLMRCCITTIDILYQENPGMAATEGQALQCQYAQDNPDHRMRFRDGAWEWDRA